MGSEKTIVAALKPGPECLPIEILAERLELPAGAEARTEVEQHVAGCGHCRTELTLLREFQSAAVRPEEQQAVDWIAAKLERTPVPYKSAKPGKADAAWWRKLWSPSGLAATLAVAAVLVIGVSLQTRPPQPVIDGKEDVYRSAPLHAVAPLGDLASPPVRFQWTPVAGAAQYALTVMEVDRTVVFSGAFKETSAPAPEQVQRLFAPGKTLEWTVAAQDASGHELANSGIQQFRTKLLQPK